MKLITIFATYLQDLLAEMMRIEMMKGRVPLAVINRNFGPLLVQRARNCQTQGKASAIREEDHVMFLMKSRGKSHLIRRSILLKNLQMPQELNHLLEVLGHLKMHQAKSNLTQIPPQEVVVQAKDNMEVPPQVHLEAMSLGIQPQISQEIHPMNQHPLGEDLEIPHSLT